MDFNQWLDAEPGRASLVAAHFKITDSAVSQWKENGVPRHRMLEVAKFTASAVTLEAMLSFAAKRKAATSEG